MTAVKKVHKFHIRELQRVMPFTDNQKLALDEFFAGKDMAMIGSAGTGKTFLGLYMGLQGVLAGDYRQVVIVRSAVAVRDLGFLPGDEYEKTAPFELPYRAICDELFPYQDCYENLKKAGTVYFLTTSHIRGITLRDSIILVDECQSLNAHELDSIITRIGPNCRLILCGDGIQTDLVRQSERRGFHDIMKVLKRINNFSVIEFGTEDIVRSGLVKDYIIERDRLGLQI